MADAIKSQGLVLSYYHNGNYRPLACAKNANITISREFLELAPKSNNAFKRFIPTKKSFTISGSGLVKIQQTYQNAFDFFEDMFQTSDVKFNAFLELIDNELNYRVYQFDCYITELTLNSTVNNFANYSYTLQGTGEFTEISTVDTVEVVDGKATARDPTLWRLVAVGFNAQWYNSYGVLTVGTSFYIILGEAMNGRDVVQVYIPI